MKVTKDLAKLFDDTDPKPDTWLELQAWVDQQTGMTLECFDLDILTAASR